MADKRQYAPDFVCVGAMKGGTTWLHEVLSEHREICLSPYAKETNIFLEDRDEIIEKLLNQNFSHGAAKQLIGEVSPQYLMNRGVAQRIYQYNSECKILYMLRNPTDRVYSHYCMYLRNENISEDVDAEMSEESHFVQGSLYSDSYAEYLSYFPAEQIGLFDFSRVGKDPIGLLTDICDFLEIDSAFRPASLEKKMNVRTGRFMFPNAIGAVYEAAFAIRKRSPSIYRIGRFLSRPFGFRLVNLFVNKSKPFPKLPDTTRARLDERFKADLALMREKAR